MYYALTNPSAAKDNGTRIAFLDLGKNELGQVIGMAVYTTPEGEAQRADLKSHPGTLTVESASSEDLLDAYGIGMPSTVYLDGERLAGSVFVGILKAELGIPLQHPQEVLLRATRMAQDGQRVGERW